MQQQDNERSSIVGAWHVDAEGAPFVPHVALFHADGTLLIHNPDAGDPQTSDSLGVGAWKVEGGHPTTIIGVLEEITPDRATHQYVNRLRVTFTLTMQGANAFTGPAEATYYAPDGTRQHDQAHQARLIEHKFCRKARVRERSWGEEIPFAAPQEVHIHQAPVPPGRECSISQADTPQAVVVSVQQPHLCRPLVRMTEEQVHELERLPIYQQLMEWMFRPLLPEGSKQANNRTSNKTLVMRESSATAWEEKCIVWCIIRPVEVCLFYHRRRYEASNNLWTGNTLSRGR